MTFDTYDVFTISLDMTMTLVLAILVLALGVEINKRSAVLRRWCIPSAVTGGILIACLHLLTRQTGILVINFTTAPLQGFFMNLFFTATGFSFSSALLKKGGKFLVILLAGTVVLTILQNVIGISISQMFGIHPMYGVMSSSIALLGGHGNAAAFAPIAEEWGFEGALTVATAAATFGLVAGAILGNPTAEFLIKKNKIEIKVVDMEESEEGLSAKKLKRVPPPQDNNFSGKLVQNGYFLIICALGLGFVMMHIWRIVLPNFEIASHVWGLLGGVIFKAFMDAKNIRVPEKEIDTLGNIFLSIFVSLAVYTMSLWQIMDLALPLITILAVQTVAMLLFAYYITFRSMGKNYDSASMVTGHIGFGLGAVPTSMANLDALTAKYKVKSQMAFFMVPIVGAGISNFTNALIITASMNLVRFW